MKIERQQMSPRLQELLDKAHGKKTRRVEIAEADFDRQMHEIKRQHPEESSVHRQERAVYRCAALALGAKRGARGARTRLATLIWWAVLGIALLLAIATRAHGQTTRTNVAYLGGVQIDPATYDTSNKAIKVNVVAGAAGGGVAQLQVGQAPDGAFINVGYFAGQLNVPVNCVVGCAGGSTTPADAFANPTTAGITVAFPAVWNGTSWDRLYGDKTSGAFVNVKVLPALSLAASTAVIGHVIVDSGAVTATLGAETTKVIGTVNVASGQTIGLVAGTAVIGHIVVDSAPSTPVTNTGTFAVQSAATLAAETTKVIGTINIASGQTAAVTQATAANLNATIVQAATMADPCANVNVAKNSVVVNASGTTAQQLIAISGSTTIYVCHYTVVGGGTTPTWVLEYGTGSVCGTGTVALNTAFAIPTTTFTVGWGGTIHKTAAGNALCTLLAGTSPTAKGYLTYVQQ